MQKETVNNVLNEQLKYDSEQIVSLHRQLEKASTEAEKAQIRIKLGALNWLMFNDLNTLHDINGV